MRGLHQLFLLALIALWVARPVLTGAASRAALPVRATRIIG